MRARGGARGGGRALQPRRVPRHRLWLALPRARVLGRLARARCGQTGNSSSRGGGGRGLLERPRAELGPRHAAGKYIRFEHAIERAQNLPWTYLFRACVF